MTPYLLKINKVQVISNMVYHVGTKWENMCHKDTPLSVTDIDKLGTKLINYSLNQALIFLYHFYQMMKILLYKQGLPTKNIVL